MTYSSYMTKYLQILQHWLLGISSSKCRRGEGMWRRHCRNRRRRSRKVCFIIAFPMVYQTQDSSRSVHSLEKLAVNNCQWNSWMTCHNYNDTLNSLWSSQLQIMFFIVSYQWRFCMHCNPFIKCSHISWFVLFSVYL